MLCCDDLVLMQLSSGILRFFIAHFFRNSLLVPELPEHLQSHFYVHHGNPERKFQIIFAWFKVWHSAGRSIQSADWVMLTFRHLGNLLRNTEVNDTMNDRKKTNLIFLDAITIDPK